MKGVYDPSKSILLLTYYSISLDDFFDEGNDLYKYIFVEKPKILKFRKLKGEELFSKVDFFKRFYTRKSKIDSLNVKLSPKSKLAWPNLQTYFTE
ncbi:hypothetical protein K8R66_02640 [bacterium]|nr:hypothetical protein [bacterium]